jgi:hypothetical protein
VAIDEDKMVDAFFKESLAAAAVVVAWTDVSESPTAVSFAFSGSLSPYFPPGLKSSRSIYSTLGSFALSFFSLLI